MSDAKWSRLENAAKIFPSTTSREDTKVFRFTCELTEMVQEATEETTATEAAEIPETPGAEVQTELSGSEAVEVTTTEAETEMATADVETGTEEIPQTDAPEDIAEDSVTAFVNRLYNVFLELSLIHISELTRH